MFAADCSCILSSMHLAVGCVCYRCAQCGQYIVDVGLDGIDEKGRSCYYDYILLIGRLTTLLILQILFRTPNYK